MNSYQRLKKKNEELTKMNNTLMTQLSYLTELREGRDKGTRMPDITRKEDGKVFPVYAYIRGMTGSLVPTCQLDEVEVYCKDWDGVHVIGKDCEWHFPKEHTTHPTINGIKVELYPTEYWTLDKLKEITNQK